MSINKNTRDCPICSTRSQNAKLFLENNIDSSKLSVFSFSSRKTPEFMSHRMVLCPTCDLVYANDPPTQDELSQAYHVAQYDSSEEAKDAAEAYLRGIDLVLSKIGKCKSVLEIGTGTGIFLEYLKDEGFTELIGVEPSEAAIDAAPSERQKWIRKGVFHEYDFVPESFDLICCFMTMEHVHSPNIIPEAALRLLRPGGAFVIVTHDYRGLVNRLLGKRSPIIDIEHMQLFSQRSLRYLFEKSGYSTTSINTFANTYSFQYWLRLMPLPRFLKQVLLDFMKSMGLEGIKIKLNVGNLITIGYKNV